MIVIGSDHAGFPLKEEIKTYLEQQGIQYEDVGCYTPERFDYAISAQKACDMVVAGKADKAIPCCGTGAGLAIAMVDAFLNTEFEGGRHQTRVDQIMAIENGEKLY